MTDALLTAGEVAARLSISVDAVRAMARRGQLPPIVRLGRRVRWREAEIASLIAAREPTPAALP